ncbi:hypothetical protein [Lysobacter gummosus]|uniref:hypothetical protein n=1 Tax=Lysobacter gummosus TaxID=262324 RepID=UPI0036362DA9
MSNRLSCTAFLLDGARGPDRRGDTAMMSCVHAPPSSRTHLETQHRNVCADRC